VEFERRGVNVAGISVDPPERNAAMVGKLLLTFPLLSDARGDLTRRYELWNSGEGVAVPAIVLVDRSGKVRYFYSGVDFADRPGDEEVFAALDGLEGFGAGYTTGAPEVRVSAAGAREESIRPDRPAMELDRLLSYYRGAVYTTVALERRFEEMPLGGRAVETTAHYAEMVRGYEEAVKATTRMHRERES
jgi:fermentation-respiration switch protein FrsA (DUF1100 family)